MSYEGMLPLPDYDGGPRDRLREMARQAEQERQMERLNELATLRMVLSYVVSDDSEVQKAAELLYETGYRRRVDGRSNL